MLGERDEQTDIRQMHRPWSAYYMGSDNTQCRL